MAKTRFTHEPKLYRRSQRGGFVYLIEYCEEGRRRYLRTHEGVCSCRAQKSGSARTGESGRRKRPWSEESRPCEHLALAIQALENFRVPRPGEFGGDVALSFLFDEWTRQESFSGRRPGTILRNSYAIRDFRAFCREKGIGRTSEVTSDLLLEFRVKLKTTGPGRKRTGYSDHYVNGHLRVLRTIFFWAARRGMMKSNPLAASEQDQRQKIVQKKAHDARPINPLSREEIEKIRSAPESRVRDMALVFLYTGMRLGELVHLTFDQVREEHLRVEAHDGWVPKTGRPRVIPLKEVVREILERRRVEAQARGTRYVFSTTSGRPLWERNTQRDFFRFFKRLQIQGQEGRGATIHGLRHTAATYWLSAGIPVTTVRDWLGHADLATTMIYYHWIESHSAESMEKFDY